MHADFVLRKCSKSCTTSFCFLVDTPSFWEGALQASQIWRTKESTQSLESTDISLGIWSQLACAAAGVWMTRVEGAGCGRGLGLACLLFAAFILVDNNLRLRLGLFEKSLACFAVCTAHRANSKSKPCPQQMRVIN